MDGGLLKVHALNPDPAPSHTLLLFDIDGTLLRTGGAGSRALNRVFRERYGVDGVVRWLDGIDALAPNLLAVHAIRVQPDEVAMVAAGGVSVSHNPFSNFVAGDRTAPVADYIAAGITVGLGTDGAANNDSQTVLDAMKVTRLLEQQGWNEHL